VNTNELRKKYNKNQTEQRGRNIENVCRKNVKIKMKREKEKNYEKMKMKRKKKMNENKMPPFWPVKSINI